MPCTIAVVLNGHCLSTLSTLLFGLFFVWGFFVCLLVFVVFFFKECVSELSEASLCCNLDTGIFGDEVLNKNIYSGKKRNEKETKTLPPVYCIMSCCPHFSLETNRYDTEVNSASSIHIYHFSKGCYREDEDQYELIFSGNG